MITFEERRNGPMNLITSYNPDDDFRAVALGYRFLGAAWDSAGNEVHVFEMVPYEQMLGQPDEQPDEGV